jgi:hypothetical protein
MPRVITPERKEYKRQWFKTHRAQINKQARQRRQNIREFVCATKKALTCIRCGESNPVCLDFHHRDPQQKLFSIASSVEGHRSKQLILAEIAKCDVLCANCHRKEHDKGKCL